MSRTDLDFEQALRAEGTVLIKESLDVNSLGVESPSPSNRTFHSPRTPAKSIQPGTPTVVPATPSPAAGMMGKDMRFTGPPSTSSSSSDALGDAAADNDHQVKRRSMYRSPGTSSSPDLATLLRKSRERGGGVLGMHKHEKRRESPPPLPDRTGTGHRRRSSTTVTPPQSPPITPLPKKNRLQPAASPDWIMPSPSPRSHGDGSPKPTKNSVRAKTSAFLGKMLGQGTTRERSKTDAGSASTSLSAAFAPPVPPVPSEFKRRSSANSSGPSRSPIADVFSTTTLAPPSPSPPSPSLSTLSPPSDLSKPLPPINSQPPNIIDEEHSMVIVEKPATPSAPQMMRSKSAEMSGTYGKRRSISLSDKEIKNAPASSPASDVPPTPPTKRAFTVDTNLNGILDEFKGEWDQFEASSPTSFDLHDPSTPARRAAYRRSNPTTPSHSIPTTPASPTRANLTKHESLTTPIFTMNLQDDDNVTSSLVPDVPPRSSSLQTSPASSAPSSFGSPRGFPSRVNNTLRGPRPLGNRNGLGSMHRSAASSSEPSLMPLINGEARSVPNRSSQQDLFIGDSKRFPSVSPSRNSGDDEKSAQEKGRELAQRCWDEDEDFLAKEKIAEWLGGTGLIRKVALQYYMDNFDFSGLRLDLAFRRLCAKLFLKAETQQVDRILETFSRRYWQCNPSTAYGSANIVHAVSYSLLLLNTDLHVADLVTRMSKSQFVRNTLTAIQMQLDPTPATAESVSDATSDSSSLRGSEATHTESRFRSKRSDSITSWNSISREAVLSTPALSFSTNSAMSSGDTPAQDQIHVMPNGPDSKSVSGSKVYDRAWETEMEVLLKEMYSAVKSNQILQPLTGRTSMSTMQRNRSLRGGPTDRLTTLKRGSIRGWQTILNQNGASPYSSNSSIDGRVSPSPSFATSTNDVLYGSSSSFLAPTLGFAHNLSHTIIREAKEDDNQSTHSNNSDSTTVSISDEELALLGAPWAKEGILCRKQYWESSTKRAKDKSWLDVFVVIQKGELSMFTFGEGGSGGSGAMGGGNWLANANSVGTVQLTHSLAHALPRPGYNRQRPHCMVLTLSHGGVYFFQAGTEELVNEWVSTCNYWAARTSKEPLTGGVSNMEYGWNRVSESMHSPESEAVEDKDDKMSVMSGRSSRFTNWREGAATVRAQRSPWNDRLFINDWRPAMPPSVPSGHDEETQMDALKKHVETLKMELQKHNELQKPMQALFQPRSTNGMKAQLNFEKKSQYLLTEIVKYDVYIDCLQAAMTLRLKKRGEKVLDRALAAGNSTDEGMSKWKGAGEETIQEADEPSSPSLTQTREGNSEGDDD